MPCLIDRPILRTLLALVAAGAAAPTLTSAIRSLMLGIGGLEQLEARQASGNTEPIPELVKCRTWPVRERNVERTGK